MPCRSLHLSVLRVAGALVLLSIIWLLPWMATNMNPHHMWLAVSFLVGNVIVMAGMALVVVNNWDRRVPEPRTVAPGSEPDVAVVIPTAGEPLDMVLRTILSVVDQDWPRDKLGIVVSDDAGNPKLEQAVRDLRNSLDGLWIQYHRPPERSTRRGKAKAGNLNSAIAHLHRTPRGRRVEFVETRDADDLVGDPGFLRRVIGELRGDERIAYVQTIKDATVDPGDPFNNREVLFYRAIMLSKNAANAVFPCGSGVVWRTDALAEVGFFPTWNLVEDLQSGVEALRRGWRGVYVPIVGAVAQTAPHDIPNVFKQRGTWAFDTARLIVHGDIRGLSPRQRAHFGELMAYYLQGVAVVVLGLVGGAWLAFGLHPVAADPVAYAIHLAPFLLMVELYFIALAHPLPYLSWWKLRVLAIGLAPTFAAAVVKAAVDGGGRELPTYRVTRKLHELKWYWRETLAQALVVLFLVVAVGLAIGRESLDPLSLAGLPYVLLLILGSSWMVRMGWYGVGGPLTHLRTRLRRSAPSVPLGRLVPVDPGPERRERP